MEPHGPAERGAAAGEAGVPTRVAVVGGGTMGVGIAYVSAVAGLTTFVVEPSADRVRALREEFQAALVGGARRGRLDDKGAEAARGRLVVLGAVAELPRGLDVVIESVPERFGLKADVLAAALARDPLVLATNTSSLSVDELATAAGGGDPSDRLLGLHFFNPVWSIGLVEVVRGRATADPVLARALRYVEVLGKECAVVADTPGFATSRLDLVAALEAMRMVEQGVGSAADIDRAVQLAYRHPVGPLRLSDIVGLDVRLDIAQQLERSLGERFAPPRLLVELVAAGHLGRKTGRGFFNWDAETRR